MTLRLVTGRANTGKTGVVHQSVRDGIADGKRCAILLPSYADVHRVRLEWAAVSPVGVEVSTLDSWATHQWMLHGDGRQPISPVARQAICGSISREAKGRLACVAQSRGLPSMLATIVSRSAGEGLPRRSDELERELVALIDRYFSVVGQRGLIEPAEAMRRLGDLPGIRGQVVAVNRFTDLSGAQEALLSGLSNRNEVVVALGWEDGHAPTEALQPLVERLRSSGAEHLHLDSPLPSGELENLEANLYASTEPTDTSGAVLVAEAAGEEAEAALTARIVGELLDEGFEPGTIAVCFRDLGGRWRLVDSALRAAGIVATVDVAIPFAHVPLGVALKQLLGTAALVGDRDDLLSFLRGPFSGVDPGDVDEFDRECRRQRIVDIATVMQRAKRLSGGIAKSLALAQSLVSGSGAGARETWHQLLMTLLDNRGSVDPAQSVECRLDTRAAAQVMEAASDIGDMASLGAMGLLDSLACASISSGGSEDEHAVQVTEVHRLRSRRFEALVIGGLTAHEFSSEKPEPLAVTWLRRLGLPTGTEERLSERLLFYSVATRAKGRLVLLRQSSTSEGQPIRPSVFYDEVADLYRSAEDAAEGEPGRLVPKPEHLLPLSRLAHAAPVFDVSRRPLRDAATAGELRPPRSVRGRLSMGQALLGPDDELSASDIETYYKCPYQWFFDRVVRPQGLDRSFEAAEKGSYAHELLGSFYERFRCDVADRVTPESLSAALELLEMVIAEKADEPRVRGLAEKLSAEVACDWARRTIVQDAELFSGLAPIEHEWSFGTAADRPVRFAGVQFKGRIDRLDGCPQCVVVTDYKSSASVKGAKSIKTYGMFQAVIYSAVAADLLGRPVAGSLYRSLPTGEMRGFWNADVAPTPDGIKDGMPADKVEALVEWAQEAVVECVEGIRAGCIEPKPRRNDSCTYCGAFPVCKEARR